MRNKVSSVEHGIRLLQKVVRDSHDEGIVRTYRYDLLADCSESTPQYVIRAHVARMGREGEYYSEMASIARPIYGAGCCVREVFLDVAYADRPVDPVHLGDVMQDRCAETDVDDTQLQTEESLNVYYQYEAAWRKPGRG